MAVYEETVYLTISATTDYKGDVNGFKVNSMVKSRPTSPSGMLVEVVLRLPKEIIAPSIVADLSVDALQVQAEDVKRIHDSL